MARPVHRFLARFDLLTWHALVRRSAKNKQSINRTINEDVKRGNGAG